MPFELGIFVGAKTFGGDQHRRKACIVFDTDRYRYQKFISDIAGQDVREHHCSTRAVIHQLRDFLSAHVGREAVLPGGRTVVERYREFRAQFIPNCKNLRLDRGRLTFRDLTVLVTSWIEANPLPHHAAISSREQTPSC
jgi:hypothetical protein